MAGQTWKVEWVDPKTLQAHPDNYNHHPDEQLQDIDASIGEFGVYQPIIISSDGFVLCHEGVTTSSLRTGQAKVPVRRMDFAHDTPQARKLMVIDNESRRLASPDEADLAQLLTAIADESGLQGTGFTDDSLAALLEQVEAQAPPTGYVPQEDEGPGEPPEEPVTRLGDVWCMGEHRLVCGDCREAHLWETLLGKRKVRLVWTDPPYGVGYVGGTQDPRSENYRSGDAIANDSMTEQETEDLCRDALAMACAFGEVGAACYASIPGTLLRAFVVAYSNSGFTLKHSLTWVKQQFVFGRCDYHYRHETILYGWKEDGAHYFVDDRTKDSVFNVDKPHRSEEHPTMKPVELVAEMVANSSRKGETVADPFLGSGTTLIACEQLGRKCVGIELSPAYCDVICRRYTKLTGKPAILEATGETFDALQQQK